MATDKAAMLAEYEKKINKPFSKWGSLEITGFYRFIEETEKEAA